MAIASFALFAQGELDEQNKIFYRNERTFAVTLNSNGFGGNYRFAKRIDGFRKTLYEVEANYLKHPKERRITIEQTNRSIVFGKLNAVYTLKGAIGNQKELFQKRDLGGISIRRFFTFGASVAFLKPVYFEYWDPNTEKPYYDTFLRHGYFAGRAPFTMGFGEISLSPGINGKFGFTFEYSKIDEIFRALEAGICIDAYLLPIKIMDTPSEKMFFLLPGEHFIPTLYISYRFGKVIDTKFNPKKTAIDDMLID